ncbi:RfaL protein [Bisgaardia hudsonensis]|nr:RfaL protein [Bisgaardia hudsonensis]
MGSGYLIFLIKKKKYLIDTNEKLLIFSYLFYFGMFLLSFIVHRGNASELDNPSRLILLLPLLLLFYQYQIRFKVLLYSIPIGSVIVGLVALYDRFYLNVPRAFSPRIMAIQGGDIAMSLGMFSLVIALYFLSKKEYRFTVFCLIATLFGMLGSFLSTARGGWIGSPFIIGFILFTYRKTLSKRFFIIIGSLMIISVVSISLIPKTQVISRINLAKNEMVAYFEKDRANTSLGARFEMWKSAVLMAKEKPILGWGQQGVIEKRKQQAKEKIIHPTVARFDHAHNQYLDDLSKRGVLGLLALLGILLMPLWFFIKSSKSHNLEIRSVVILGIVHISSVMFYNLSQGFFTHNSGNIFYFFLIIVFYAMIKTLNLKSENN